MVITTGEQATAADIIAMGLVVADTQVFNTSPPTSWTDLDLSAVVGAKSTLVLLKVQSNSGSNDNYAVRRNGDTDQFYNGGITGPAGVALGDVSSACLRVFLVATDSNGVIEHICERDPIILTIDVMAFIRIPSV